MEILIRKLSWWVWGPERGSISGKSLRDAASPRTTLKTLMLCKKGGLCISHQRRMRFTPPLQKLFLNFVYMWICVLGTGALGAQKMALESMLPELLWEPNSGPRCMLLTTEPLPQSYSSFLAGRVCFPGVILQIPTF